APALGSRAGVSDSRLHHSRAASLSRLRESGVRPPESRRPPAHSSSFPEPHRRRAAAHRLQPPENSVHAPPRRIALPPSLRPSLSPRSSRRCCPQNACSLQRHRKMDRRHLSIERASPPGHLADRRSGVGHGRSGSKTPSPASFARTPGKNVRAMASLAGGSRSTLLASLFEQARPAHIGNFALAGNRPRFIGECECHQFFLAETFLR